jgi:hypothetical protein
LQPRLDNYIEAYRAVEDMDARALAAGSLLMGLCLFRYFPRPSDVPAAKAGFEYRRDAMLR